VTSAALLWSVVLPVKRLEIAKTRLATPERAALALAMALDTAAAALAGRRVACVVAVCDDPTAAAELRSLGVQVVPDLPDAGLNPALRHGVAAALADLGSGVAAVSADLPALRPAELDLALDAAAGHEQAVVPDVGGLGTTMYAVRDQRHFRPEFGTDSLARHLRGGAMPIILDGIDGLRRDVDTLVDLAAADALGLGAHTSAVLARSAAGR